MSKGLLIALEGSECAGKSTQLTQLISRVSEYYPHLGPAYSSEPSYLVRDAVTKEDIDDVTRLFLIAAGRAETYRKVAKPALDNGKVYLTDRFILSTLVYQYQYPDLAWLSHYYAADGIMPDLTIVYDIPAELARERLRLRGELDVLEDVPIRELRRRNHLFLEYVKSRPNVCRLDGTLSIDELANKTWGLVHKRIQNAGIATEGERK